LEVNLELPVVLFPRKIEIHYHIKRVTKSGGGGGEQYLSVIPARYHELVVVLYGAVGALCLPGASVSFVQYDH
jgi:hypothetical protein